MGHRPAAKLPVNHGFLPLPREHEKLCCPVDPRLQKAIATPKIQMHAGELVRLALAALDDLKRLDEGLYERFVASREAREDASSSNDGLRKLWDLTFAGLKELLYFIQALEGEHKKPEDAAPPTDDASFDFGDLEGGGGPAHGNGELDFASLDVGDLLSGLGEEKTEGDAEKWARILDKVLSIEYGLRSQQTEGRQRMEVALEAGEINQVLGLLDDTCSSASEGVHALVSTVFETFVPDVNPASVVPGYLTSLGRALLVRRGLAELASTLTPLNDRLQGEETSRHGEFLTQVRDTLRAFVGSVVCRAMRPADRWQMVEFDRELSTQPPSVARLTSEGLVKYLDSLGSINQREVLLVHDQRAIEQMRESIANARQLVDISPRTAAEMMDRAYQAAQRLRGRRPATDQLVIQLEKVSPTSPTPAEPNVFLAKLEEVLAASG